MVLLAGPASLAPAPQLLPRSLASAGQLTRFFTGNQAIDSAAWGAVLGAGTQYFANQVVNPCRGGTRGTNNRIFGNSAVDNGLLGFLGGFAAATVAHNAAGRPCG